jgi:hypothetical protein
MPVIIAPTFYYQSDDLVTVRMVPGEDLTGIEGWTLKANLYIALPDGTPGAVVLTKDVTLTDAAAGEFIFPVAPYTDGLVAGRDYVIRVERIDTAANDPFCDGRLYVRP